MSQILLWGNTGNEMENIQVIFIKWKIVYICLKYDVLKEIYNFSFIISLT